MATNTTPPPPSSNPPPTSPPPPARTPNLGFKAPICVDISPLHGFCSLFTDPPPLPISTAPHPPPTPTALILAPTQRTSNPALHAVRAVDSVSRLLSAFSFSGSRSPVYDLTRQSFLNMGSARSVQNSNHIMSNQEFGQISKIWPLRPAESSGKTGVRPGYLSAKVRMRAKNSRKLGLKVRITAVLDHSPKCLTREVTYLAGLQQLCTWTLPMALDNEAVTVDSESRTMRIELTPEIEALGTVVGNSNIVKGKGYVNADLMDLEEDDEMDE
ncbi:hypothetical protein C8R47DRAFT_1196108 [Mycena vitilis]|nr:hypothetical protein C8R47DRAFT_1196108 [Mycena vitilis]